jgi:hypothetical protein
MPGTNLALLRYQGMKNSVSALIFAGFAVLGGSQAWAQVTVPSAVSPIPSPSPSPFQGLSNVLHNPYLAPQGQQPSANPVPLTPLPTAIPSRGVAGPGR